jgi:hypothetical protein
MATITVLHNSSRRLSKAITYRSASEASIASYDNAKTFSVEQKAVEDIEGFSALLSTLQSDTHRLIIRGTPHPEADLTKPVRRKDFKPNAASINEAPFQDLPQPWLMLDIDKLKLPESIDILKDPHKAIAYAIEQLPAAFQDATVHWQLSASAGIKGTAQVSAHLFYWLSEPASSQRLKQWGDAINKLGASKLIDTALFQSVQIHYTADPVFQGMIDPFAGKRSGLLKKAVPSVVLDFSVISDVAPRQTPASTSAYVIREGGVENILATLGDQDGGQGFNDPLLRATASHARTVGALAAESDREAFKAMLRERIDQANQSNHSQSYIDVKKSDAFLDALIASAIEKFGIQPPPHFDVKELSLDEAQAKLHQTIASFGDRVKAYGDDPSLAFDDAPVLAIRATAGLGKTSEIIKTLIDRNLIERGDIHYFVPTHKLSEQLMKDLDKALDFDIPDPFNAGQTITYRRTSLIAGRGQIGKDGKPLCLKIELAKRVASMGESVSKRLCKSGSKKCELYDTCAYQQQFDPEEIDAFFAEVKDAQKTYSEVKVMTHQHLFLNTKDRMPKPKLVVIDEAFWQTGIEELRVTPSDLPAANKPICSFISEALIRNKSTSLLQDLRDAGYESQHLREEATLIDKENSNSDALRPDMFSKQQEQLLGTRRWTNNAPIVLRQLAAELAVTDRKTSHTVRFEPPSNKNNPQADKVIVSRRKALTIPFNVPVILIDANAQPAILEQFRDNVELVDIPVERQAVINQFTDLSFSKYSFDTSPAQIKEVQAFIAAVSKTGKTLAVASKAIRHKLTGIDPKDEKSTLYKGATYIHFGNLRGLNDFEGFDNVIIVGREQLPSNALEDLARGLWWDAETPLMSLEDAKGSTPLGKTTRTYRASEFKVVQVGTHPDPRVQLVLEQVREAESEQAIDRLRLLRPPKGQQRQVFILSSVPLNVSVNHFYGWKQLHQCLALLEEADGVLPLNPAHLVLRCPNTASSERTARRLSKDLETATSLINKYISKVATSKIYYRTEGTKKPSSAIVSDRLSKAEVEAALTACAGKPVSI